MQPVCMHGRGFAKKLTPIDNQDVSGERYKVMLKPIWIPRSNALGRQIALAMLIKIVLLTGLWYLLYRWPEKPVAKPDIAAHFLHMSP
jgi:hypothetical protein